MQNLIMSGGVVSIIGILIGIIYNNLNTHIKKCVTKCEHKKDIDSIHQEVCLRLENFATELAYIKEAITYLRDKND